MTATGWRTVPCNLVARCRCFGIACCLVFRMEECCIDRGTKFLQNFITLHSSSLVMDKERNFEMSVPLIPLIYLKIGALFFSARFRLFCQITWRHLVEDTRLHIRCSQPLESYTCTSTLVLHGRDQCSAEQCYRVLRTMLQGPQNNVTWFSETAE
jgi:hypothetical protein